MNLSWITSLKAFINLDIQRYSTLRVKFKFFEEYMARKGGQDRVYQDVLPKGN